MNHTLNLYVPSRAWAAKIKHAAIGAGLLLLLFDLLFLIFHLGLNFGYLSDRRFHLEVDAGYAEQFQYLKYFLSSVLLLTMWLRRGKMLRFVLALLIAFLLVEDYAGLHEHFHLLGERVVSLSSLDSFAKNQLWEMIYGVTVGGGLLLLLLYAIVRTEDRQMRQWAAAILLLIVILGGFGVAVDALHSIVQAVSSSAYLESFVGVVEDWGEMVTTSCITLLVVDDAVRHF